MTEIKVVKIKTWDKMVIAYGLSDDKTFIKTEKAFSRFMEAIIPENRIIKVQIDNNDILWRFDVDDFNDVLFISEDMIEEELDINDYPEYFV